MDKSVNVNGGNENLALQNCHCKFNANRKTRQELLFTKFFKYSKIEKLKLKINLFKENYTYG